MAAKSFISRGDITELKALAKPPQIVIDNLSATALLLGHNEREAKEWKCTISMLASPSFLSQLENHDSKTCSPQNVALAKQLLQPMSADKVKNVSMASMGIYNWNLAVISAAGGDS